MLKNAISACALLSLAVATPASANGYKEKGKAVEVAKSTMIVTPPRDWNELSARPGKKAVTWTLDGEQLNDVTWYGGIAPGEPLVRERDKKREPLPKLTRETLIIEVPELVEATYRASKGIGTFKTTSTVPDRFLDRDGIRFTYEYVDNDNLPRQGEARAVLVKGALYMVTFDAPRLHFYDESLSEFRALSDAAKLK